MYKKVYIFNGMSRAAVYGIGTYIEQLTVCLKNTAVEFEVVHLHGKGTEVSISEENGYKQISVPSCSFSAPDSYSYYFRNVAYLLKEFIPEDKNREYIFHLNFMGNEALVKYLKKMFKCKILLVAHYTNWSFTLSGDYSRLRKLYGQPMKKLKDKSEKAVVKEVKNDLKIIRKVDRFVCVGEQTLDILQKLSDIPKGKSEVVNNALADTYCPVTPIKKKLLREKYHVHENSKIVVFAGRLDEGKGIPYLIRAFKKMREKHPGSCLFILGDGYFDAWMKEAADCWSKIIFTGRLEKEKVYDFYKLSDFGIVPSLHEEFGFVAVEMMMHALPVIVTKTGGLDEIVEDGISGLKVPVRTVKGKRTVDVKTLTEKMNYLCENPEEAGILGENGRKRFLDKYNLPLFKEKMLNIYETI